MARTVLEERIGGELVRVEITIGVIEAVAEIEPERVTALAKLQRGHYRLMRAVIGEGAKAAGRANVGQWLDALIEDAGDVPLHALAFRALADSYAKEAAAVGKAAAATEATTEAPAS